MSIKVPAAIRTLLLPISSQLVGFVLFSSSFYILSNLLFLSIISGFLFLLLFYNLVPINQRDHLYGQLYLRSTPHIFCSSNLHFLFYFAPPPPTSLPLLTLLPVPLPSPPPLHFSPLFFSPSRPLLAHLSLSPSLHFSLPFRIHSQRCSVLRMCRIDVLLQLVSERKGGGRRDEG